MAITRAVRNLYIVESDTAHEILTLLGIHETNGALGMAAQSSSRDEWQREARRLELQGKQEQAEEIRRQILRTPPVPWKVLDPKTFTETLDQALDSNNVSKKPKEQILEYAAYYGEPRLGALLAENGYEKGRSIAQWAPTILRKYLSPFEAKNLREVLSQVDQYGVDHRNAFHQTPLMCAARQGNVPLVEALMVKGADPGLTDNYGRTAFHQALMSAAEAEFARTRLGPIYPRLAPSSVDLQCRDRLVKLDAHMMEYFLFNVMLALLHRRLNARDGHYVFEGFGTADFLEYGKPLPENVLTEPRKKRAYLSAVLSRNEVDRDYAYNRRIFLRLRTGRYTLNPGLKVRVGDSWVSLHEHLGFGLMQNRAWPRVRIYQERIQLRQEAPAVHF